MKNKVLAGLIAGTALITLAACGGNNASGTSGKVNVVGSTALQPLAQAAVNGFTNDNPNAQVTVQGGGSGAGLTAVSNGTADIGNSDIFAEQKSGIDASKLNDNKVAVVGFAAVVNASNGVSNLTTQQLVDIFTGKVTNWKQVGGSDEAIVVIGRTEGSGTRVNFDKLALNGATEKTATTQDATNGVVTAVGQTKGAISYLAFSGLNGASGVKSVSIDGVAPTDANVETNTYKVWSYEHMYTNKDKATDTAKSFISYVAKDSTNIKKMGYISTNDMKVERDAAGNITKK
ncbi:MAG: phosphate ABC transporter substrate-binding protein [Streptococcaceae bacterium]|nr:phosphate ABC transporter substrate-binding protein [Streptococcaceae bacterium]MCL2681572.1 phosphate ABC transporter substrate-binding protein [Streptococcaceae bacterium]MCL2858344.1 phosphate ABC transporter substrate-binding protein [Streptococcaceae bacterium]